MVQIVDIVLRFERRYEARRCQAFLVGKQFGFQLVVDERIEAPRVVCRNQVDIAVVHTDDAERLELSP